MNTTYVAQWCEQNSTLGSTNKTRNRKVSAHQRKSHYIGGIKISTPRKYNFLPVNLIVLISPTMRLPKYIIAKLKFSIGFRERGVHK